MQRPVHNGDICVGWNDVNAIRFDRPVIHRFVNRHPGRFGQNLGEQAVMLRIEMLNQNHGYAGLRGQSAKKLLQSFESARGGSHANHEKGTRFGGRARGQFLGTRSHIRIIPDRFGCSDCGFDTTVLRFGTSVAGGDWRFSHF
ncbi:MAG: hypothetical protein WAM66_01235 [Acidobacteriaceae bacterium]